MILEKVISGGQTGVDQIGLKTARLTGIETGGTAPLGFKTELGPEPKLIEYGLTQSNSPDYPPRTEDNVKDSDGTVIFGDMNTPGCKLTLKFVRMHRRPVICNPTDEQLVSFIEKNKIKILNVAGNRGSKLSKEDRQRYGSTLLSAFQILKSKL